MMAPDVLEDLRRAITGIIDDLHFDRSREGASAHYFDRIGKLSKLVADIRGLDESLAPVMGEDAEAAIRDAIQDAVNDSARPTAAERRASMPVEVGPDLMRGCGDGA